jgi:hypothetical protein
MSHRPPFVEWGHPRTKRWAVARHSVTARRTLCRAQATAALDAVGNAAGRHCRPMGAAAPAKRQAIVARTSVRAGRAIDLPEHR